MTRLRSTIALAAGAALAVALPATAAAAPPSNDTASGATVVSTLPTTITQDTSEATTDALDATLNEQCGAPFTNGSVWFSYTDPDGGGVVADMSASTFSGGFLVTEGDPADGNVVTCGQTAVGFATSPGTTYYVVAFSDTSATGGTLVATFDEAPPPPEATIDLAPTGVAAKDGTATISGTYSCTNSTDDSFIDGQMVQTVGRLKITGYFGFGPLECDGATHAWDAVVFSDTGLFRGGKAATVSFATACGPYQCGFGFDEEVVKLTSSRKR